MKKLLIISFALPALLAPTVAFAVPRVSAVPETRTAAAQMYTVLLAGGDEANMIRIWLTPDGRQYGIDSVVPLEVGGDVCSNPEGKENELVCEAALIAGFEVNAGGGEDRVSVANQISVPVTMRGGAGGDVLSGGSGPDKLIGGTGDDRLAGGRGDDVLFGGSGDDFLLAGPGRDLLRGGPGVDKLIDGPGADSVHKQD